MSEPLIFEDVAIALDGRTLVAVDRRVAPGEVLTVMGPSGVGKSTLLAFVGGFLDPVFTATGRVRLGSTDITGEPPEARRLGLLFQDPLLFPHMSVGANLAFALARGGSRAERRAICNTMLERIELPGMASRDPDTLSGGQKARVALARVLLARPRALLLDEPFSRLDAELRGRTREIVFAAARDEGLPVLLVTHDREDAEAAGGPVIELGA